MARKAKNIQDDILLAALPDVIFDGWSDALLDRAATKLKIKPAAVHDAFPNGAVELALYFSDWADTEMLRRLTPEKLRDLRIRDKITLGVRTRLEILAPHKEAVSAALSFLGPRLTRQLWKTADKIWWAAGDTSTDHNHYTKRFLLSGVLAATTLYWINDTSRGHAGTWEFLDRRIENVLNLGRRLSGFRRRSAA